MTTPDLTTVLARAKAAQAEVRHIVEVDRLRTYAQQMEDAYRERTRQHGELARRLAALTTGAALEAAARRLHADTCTCPDTWDELYEDSRETYRQHAHDTITAALEATK